MILTNKALDKIAVLDTKNKLVIKQQLDIIKAFIATRCIFLVIIFLSRKQKLMVF